MTWLMPKLKFNLQRISIHDVEEFTGFKNITLQDIKTETEFDV